MTGAALAHDAFAPVEPAGRREGLVFALVAHALLIAALAWSVHWKTSEPEGVSAELWAAMPLQAAPRETRLPPPLPVARPRDPVEPSRPPPRPDAAAEQRTADAKIAVARAAQEAAQLKEAVRLDAAERAASAAKARRNEQQRADAERQARRVAEAERDKQRSADEQEAKKRDLAKAKQDDARSAAAHEANVRRMLAQAGGSSESMVPGHAARTAGPSATYGGRIKAYVRPFIKTPGVLAGNFTTEVEVRLSPDGTIINTRITQASGSGMWDDTVVRALTNAKSLPSDVDGTVQSPMILTFRSNE